MPSAIAIRAFGPPTMIKLYQRPRDIPTILHALSKYAIALYEMVQLRTNMERCIETFPLARFRDLLGVPPGAYKLGADFAKRVTDPAVLEVNGLSDVGVDLTLVRRNPYAPIEAVTVTWWKKEGDDFRAAMRERNRSKVGRMARLRGQAEEVSHIAIASIV